MSSSSLERAPAKLRQTVTADLAPVRRLRHPAVRALAVLPLTIVLLVAAPIVFEPRDLSSLGWMWSWGASLAQAFMGIALVAAGLREAVPGRSWSLPALVAWFALPALLLVAVTYGAWHASPVVFPSSFGVVAMCLGSSLVSGLPVIALSSILARRAWPIRPAVSGALAGFGAGLMADAGWRLFCGLSDPVHVLPSHLGSVIAAGLLGAVMSRSARER